ncbi:MAG TPA: Rrf2 family transcriptional regulator [Syntrophobacteria bacterium]|nr:Rrf2 family transcriptional regulator [Syntrophobacteria bacterium]
MLYLSARSQEDVIPRREIAQAMEIPGVFLGKIAQQLARAGIVEIMQGARGGFRLLRSPEKVTLLDVVEAVVGEIFLNDCLLTTRSCSRVERCTVHQVWTKARRQLRETLREATFAQLLKEESCLEPAGGRG